jgi:UDP-N-acetylglucosamine diphosphorylase/glucosamine-1-phosphate N-acetyltransferase
MNTSKDYLIVFEDENYRKFYPISASRPVSHILSGSRTNLQRINNYFGEIDLLLMCRPHLSPLYGGMDLNTLRKIQKEDAFRKIILVNASSVFKRENIKLIEELKRNNKFTAYVKDGSLIAATIPSADLHEIDLSLLCVFYEGNQEKLISESEEKCEIDIMSFSNIWEVINSNECLVASDYLEYYDCSNSSSSRGDSYLYKSSDIFFGENVSLDAASVVDAREGPVIIESGVQVKPFTYIKGPAYIGKESLLVGGKISNGCSFGEGCRVGGELESSIIIANSNKYHDGFIGHAYIGEWVNLGALTTNSDLSNNYSTIKIKQNGIVCKTEQIKVGCFIGDHTKIGIGVTLNTGCVIGFSSNLFGGALILEKEIPPFGWGNDSIRFPFQLSKAIDTAKIVLNRRNKELTILDERLFEHLYNSTEMQREKWIKKSSRRN